LAAAGLLNTSVHAIETAGTQFVDVDATQLPLGQLTNLPNTGETGGSFQAVGPQAAPPVVTLVGGTKGIDFDGTSFLKLADDAGTVIPTPDGLTGTDATASIEVWALNPSIAAEETLVSWGKRGGPEGSNLSFNYGNNGAFGAVGHWGNPDIGWKDAGGAPEANKWHHLVYTYDGTTTRVYADGALWNSEVLGPGVINTTPATSINLATQLDGDGVTPTGGIRGDLVIARVRIHDGVLTDAQVLSNYNSEKADFINPLPPAVAKLSKAPIHRYSFSESPTDDASGLNLVDSIGGGGRSGSGGRGKVHRHAHGAAGRGFRHRGLWRPAERLALAERGAERRHRGGVARGVG
jgi:hypothetical protein